MTGKTGFGTVLVLWALVAVAGLALSPRAIAAGSDQPKCEDGTVYSERCKECVKECEDGQVWNCEDKKCVKQESMLLDDDARYKEAVSMIGIGRFTTALKLLWSIERRENPDVLTYIGYSTRKLGNVDRGIHYYKQALALDPGHNRAREYLGEGYLQKGDVEGARGQLREIAKRCGTGCREYAMLSEAIVLHMTGEKPSGTW